MLQGGGLRAVGAHPGAAEGRRLRDVRDDSSSAVRAVTRALEGESLSYFDEEKGRTFDTRVDPLRDADGEIVGAIGLALDVTEGRRGEEELRASREELRRLAARMTQLQEEERRRIAHELHDELGQRLTALRFEAAVLPRKIGEPCTETVSQAIASMLELIDDTIVTVRRVATELRPAILDHFGLRSALEHELSQFEKRTGIRYELDISPEDVADDDARATALYRIVQESLTNVARHANATAVRVTLEERGDALVLEISDNGRGITDEEVASSLSLGLVGMRERALAQGGEATIRATPNGGSTVSVRLPKRGAS
jgi:signal transduction histidine kinase